MQSEARAGAGDPRIVNRDSLLLDEIYVDPKRNVSRGGVCDARSDKTVIELAESIRERGELLNPIAVRPITRAGFSGPIRRPCDPQKPCCFDVPGSTNVRHTVELIVGFRRFQALRALGRTKLDDSEFKIFDVDDAEAAALNDCENFIRKNPTDFDFAMACARWARLGLAPEEIRRRLGSSSENIEKMVRIVFRCPPEILDGWRSHGRRVEFKLKAIEVSNIVGPTEEATHAAMLEEWERFVRTFERTRPQKNAAKKKDEPFDFDRNVLPNREIRLKQVDAVSDVVSHAIEFFDGDTWRPFTDGERSAVTIALSHLRNPMGPMPFR